MTLLATLHVANFIFSARRLTNLLALRIHHLTAGRALRVTKTFVDKSYEKVEASSEFEDLNDLLLEPNFKIKRTNKVKKMTGEKSKDERVISSPEDAFRTDVFNCIVAKTNQTMENRFAKHLDLAVFDPTRFDQVRARLPEMSLDRNFVH